jgi:hypothetical protein
MNERRKKRNGDAEETQEMPPMLLEHLCSVSSIPPPTPPARDNRRPEYPEPPEAA